jgi:hypothetical protein
MLKDRVSSFLAHEPIRVVPNESIVKEKNRMHKNKVIQTKILQTRGLRSLII